MFLGLYEIPLPAAHESHEKLEIVFPVNKHVHHKDPTPIFFFAVWHNFITYINSANSLPFFISTHLEKNLI